MENFQIEIHSCPVELFVTQALKFQVEASAATQATRQTA
jgi:hypothetical protein